MFNNNTVLKYAQYPQQNFYRLKTSGKMWKSYKKGQFYIIFMVRKISITIGNSNM